MNSRRVLRTLSFLTAFSSSIAFAAVDPQAAPKALLEGTWPPIHLAADLANLIADTGEGSRSEADLRQKIEDVNAIWSQCGIRFIPHRLKNYKAGELGVTLHPKSQDDLGRIHGAIYPKGHNGAIPAVIAGPWDFVDKGFGLYMFGLGWAFTRGDALDRLGAMVSASKLDDTGTRPGTLLGHEIGHALSLGHVNLPDNVMAYGSTLTRDQCEQARRFSRVSLSMMIVNGRVARAW